MTSQLSKQWVALTLTVVGFLIAQTIFVVTYYDSRKLVKQTEELKFVREVYREFYLEEKTYLRIANTIEACKTVYTGNGGKFNHLQVNGYLGFFGDLGLLWKRDMLGIDLIAHYFGGFIIEAYEYAELRDYVNRLRKNFRQPKAFANFYDLAEAMKKDSQFKDLVKLAQGMCAGQEKGEQKQ